MDRRTFLKSAIVVSAAAGIADTAAAAERYFPTKAAQSIFEGINRVKDPAQKTPLEKSHAPVLKAPTRVTAGEPFIVEVAVGDVLHPMGPDHWIEYIELSIGNEPAGSIDFQSRGYLKPKAVFTVVLSSDAASAGKVTLLARQGATSTGYGKGASTLR
jgi:superoxide reductase